MSTETLSRPEARRVALAAQLLDRPRRRDGVTPADITDVVRALSLVQLDFVNVLVPAHYQVLYTRLGPFDRARLDEAMYRERFLTEHWAHEASIVPVETWPLLRHRMEAHRVRPWGFERFLEQHPAYVERVLEDVRTKGPLTADDLSAPDTEEEWLEGSWFRSVPRAVLEAHFGRGVLAVHRRLPSFARQYDLSERVIPREHHARRLSREDAQRELVRQAARAHGVAAIRDLADYHRMPASDARARVRELVEVGELREVKVDGWKAAAYLHREAKLPPRIHAKTLVSPFDPLVWTRERAARLFDFDYRVEIFVPDDQRRYGFYVLPFLLGDRLVARVDLKAERAERTLFVRGAWSEAGVNAGDVAAALASELRTLAGWLGLERVRVGRKGNLARPLASAGARR